MKIIPPADDKATVGVTFVYESGVEIVHGGPSGCVFHGEHGKLPIDRGVLTSDPEYLVQEPLGANDPRLPVSPGHHRNWLDCIKSRELPIADVEKGARTAAVIHLGNLAYWERQTFGWDPQSWKFADTAHDKFLDRTRRDAWPLPAV